MSHTPRSRNAPDAAFWAGKRVFLTGHTGFKGSWLALWLSKMGAQVLGYSLAPPSEPSLFELAQVGSSLQSVLGDIRDLQLLRSTARAFEPEIVIHMAAQSLVRSSYQNPVETYSTNVMGTVHVLEMARHQPSVRAILNITTDKCYENREWIWGYRENDPMGGFDPYSNSKGCSELVTSAYRNSFFAGKEVGLASARAGNVIGGGDWAQDRLIPDCIRSLMAGQPILVRNPDSIRPWQHVLEPLSGYLRLVELLWTKPSRYSEGFNFGPNLGDTQPVRWITDQMTSLWGHGARWEHTGETGPHEAHFLKLDCAKAHSALNWSPQLDLSQTLQWVIEWYSNYKRGEDVRSMTLAQITRYEAL